MLNGNESKIKTAITILHESKSTPELFLRRCCDDGFDGFSIVEE